MTDHDHPYKVFFSHAEMVRDLLLTFVKEDWVKSLDFSTLEKQNPSFVTDDYRAREGDVIWRVRWGEKWLYVYLLIEFQSETDPFMAVRMMTYVGLLYQELIKTGRVKPREKLPPVLPMVLFNGKFRWNAPEELGDLIEHLPGGLSRYQPALRYLLIDEGSYEDSELETIHNAVAALFRFEKSRTPEEVRRVLIALTGWIKAPSQRSLRRAFTVWLGRSFLPTRVPGQSLPEFKNLQEVNAMLSETVKDWVQQWKKEGLEQGLEQGREEGLKQGADRERRVLVRRMLSLGQPSQAVAEFTGLALEEVLQIAEANEEYPAGDTMASKKVSEPRRRASRKKP